VYSKKENKFYVEVDEEAMVGSHELTFINSCDVNDDGTVKVADEDEEDEGPMMLSVNVDVL